MPLPDSLLELISRGESEALEFKRGIGERSAAAKAICGMLNGTRGGTVIFGVRDDGSIVGIDIGHETHNRLNGELSKLDPSVTLDLETVTFEDGRSLIVIRVPGNTGLYRYDGRAYQRFGASTQVMPESSYQTALLERHHAMTRWENQTAGFVSISDLDFDEILTTINAAIHAGRLADPGTREPTALLNGLNLLKDGQLLNAALVLFGKQHVLEQFYPQCRLRMARFRGLDKSEFIDNRQVVGHIGVLLAQAQSFWASHIEIAGRIDPDRIERIDIPAYPLEALREALANAVCHRDYAEAGGAIDLAIYDDRLEITSTGPLRFGLTVADLQREHQSKLWNPIIANTLYKRGVIESWGRGTLKMIQVSRDAGYHPPEFLDARLDFTVRFLAEGYTAPTRVSHDLTELQREILRTLERIGPNSSVAIAMNLSHVVDQRQVLRNLQALREFGLVSLAGEKRWAKWSLVI